jgi:hypothetical protein
MTEAQSLPKPAWYQDPGDPIRDRWWSGTQWTKYTAKKPRGSAAWLGVEYPRSMRAGANRVLIPARILNLVALLGFLALLIFAPLVIARPAGTAGVEFAVIGILGIACGLVAAALGAIGLTRAKRFGGFGLSIWAIVVGGLFSLFNLVPLLIAVLATR